MTSTTKLTGSAKRLLAFCGTAASLMAQPLPNVVILYGDDMGIGDLGVNNPDSKIPTPNLDRMAAQGMNLKDGHASSGICTPSRYALLTGRAHWRDFHGIVGAFGRPVFKENQLTLPRMLTEKGYSTVCIGKWHLGWDWNALRKPGTESDSIQPEDFDWNLPIPGGPLAVGFDRYFGDDVINIPPYTWIEDDRIFQAPDVLMDTDLWMPIKEGRWECREGPMVSDWDPYEVMPTLTRRSVDFILSRKDQTQPFFLYHSFPSPHAPIIPNDEFDGISQAGPYGDFVYETDDAVGQILRALEEIGQADNTLVIFSSDNGAENYAFERDQKYDHWSSAPFRGRKRDIYEGGHHVPTIIRWPGVIQPGTVSTSLFAQTDIMATVAAVVGYELPTDSAEDSFDFLPYLKGETSSGPRTAMVHNTSRDKYAIRDGDWLLIDAPTGYTSRPPPDEWYFKHGYTTGDDLPVELYNLKADLGQRHNLAAGHPERILEMRALLQQLREQGYTAPRLRTP
jgi:arylsulfatase A